MNLVDKLLKADVKKTEELATGIYKSKRLAMILGTNEKTVDVKICEIPTRRFNDIIAYQVDHKGQIDYSKSFDAKLMLCVEGVVEPELKNKELQVHFGASNGRELCEKIFRTEITELSDAISVLSGINDVDDVEDEVKN